MTAKTSDQPSANFKIQPNKVFASLFMPFIHLKDNGAKQLLHGPTTPFLRSLQRPCSVLQFLRLFQLLQLFKWHFHLHKKPGYYSLLFGCQILSLFLLDSFWFAVFYPCSHYLWLGFHFNFRLFIISLII